MVRLILHRQIIADTISRDPAVQAGVRQIAEAGRDGAKRRCPVDTGRLRDSIRTQKISGGWRWGTDVPYAPYVEYGTYNHRAQPFIRPSLDDAKRAADRIRL